jgi:hypothetical protein
MAYVTLVDGNGAKLYMLLAAGDGTTTSTPGTAQVGQGVPTATAANSWWVQGPAAANATAAGNPVQVGGVYNSSITALTSGQQGQLQQDATQNMLMAIRGTTVNGMSKPTAGSPIQNLSATTKAIKTSPGTLYHCIVENTQTTTAYVQLFDVSTTTGVTLGSTKPDLEIIATGGVNTIVPLGSGGWPAVNGIMAAATTGSGGSTGSSNGVSLFPVYA